MIFSPQRNDKRKRRNGHHQNGYDSEVTPIESGGKCAFKNKEKNKDEFNEVVEV